MHGTSKILNNNGRDFLQILVQNSQNNHHVITMFSRSSSSSSGGSSSGVNRETDSFSFKDS